MYKPDPQYSDEYFSIENIVHRFDFNPVKRHLIENHKTFNGEYPTINSLVKCAKDLVRKVCNDPSKTAYYYSSGFQVSKTFDNDSNSVYIQLMYILEYKISYKVSTETQSGESRLISLE